MDESQLKRFYSSISVVVKPGTPRRMVQTH